MCKSARNRYARSNVNRDPMAIIDKRAEHEVLSSIRDHLEAMGQLADEHVDDGRRHKWLSRTQRPHIYIYIYVCTCIDPYVLKINHPASIKTNNHKITR